MIIYSKRVITFIQEIKAHIRDILTQEIHLKSTQNRFYSKNGKYSYPISVVIFDKRPCLGYFDAEFYELGFNVSLMHTSKKQLKNIIRHELAHYMVFIHGSPTEPPHGEAFKAYCQSVGWDKSVYQASTCLESAVHCDTEVESGIFRKVKKLMALAESSNEHEAELAMIKSQQLLLKHNIETKCLNEDDDKIILKRVLRAKRQSSKLRAIAKILETFFVSIVFHGGKDNIHLEVIGSRVNVNIADYVANVLDSDLEHLWGKAKEQHLDLKGTRAKNSFFIGIARGYCKKIGALKKEHTKETSRALVVVEKKLMNARAIVYPRLSSSRSHAGYCGKSSKLGETMGKSLNIHPAVQNPSKKEKAFLT
ncbi:MAG: hypothetical protein S4CHLAM37_01570 [Chlamydiia bacterium]|nr:hypothetical protein [Chlamydiia bacterium]